MQTDLVPWFERLQELADRVADQGLIADLDELSPTELLGVYAFLKHVDDRRQETAP